jgi:hypothetical protein
MAEIDHRVRLLTDLLMERGFGWLASEIVTAIEFGRTIVDDTDHTVFDQRKALQAELSRSDVPLRRGAMRRELSKPTVAAEIESSAERLESERTAFLPDEQVEIAVEFLMFRLSDSVKMLASSVEAMEEIFGGQMKLFAEVDGRPHPIDTIQASAFASRLENIREQLREWLLSQQPSEGS